MGKSIIVLIFLAVTCIALSDEVHAKDKISRERNLEEVDSKLKLLNKPAVKSIKSLDGDIIDCVDIYKQPAFDHPALRNHTIQLKPSFHIASEEEKRSNKNESSSPKFNVLQIWQKSGTCPKGTIPIRRVTRQDLLRADSLDRFGRKSPNLFNVQNHTNQNDIVYVNNTKLNFPGIDNRSVAILVTSGFNFIGAQGDINLWNPRVASLDEYTTAQIWLKHGPFDSFDSVEAGWTVNPKVYGDKQTRLFVSWTTDSYKSTGCFDLLCNGFVQTNPNISLGAALGPWSSDMGPQYQITVAINMDPNTNNWWVKLTNGITVGYFPGTLFSYLSHSAILVQWGGEVYSPNLKKPSHTTTAMGSGQAAATMEGSACYIKGVRIVDYSLSLKYPMRVDTWADEPHCYSALNYIKGYTYEPVFLFGGPGRNTLCP